EQMGELVLIHFEPVEILRELGDPHLLHPFADAAFQAAPLVAREVEPTVAPKELEEGLELRVRTFGLAQGSSPPVTSFRMACEISLRESTKSTSPVSIAALGIPKYSELSGSCTRTVPPI